MTARPAVRQPFGSRHVAARGGEDEPGQHGPRKRGNHRNIYAAGETIPESGIYEVVHEESHRAMHESVLVKGDPFPHCDTCHDRVRFRVVRTAPYIFHDEDFGEES
jgi:hypothetical protein